MIVEGSEVADTDCVHNSVEEDTAVWLAATEARRKAAEAALAGGRHTAGEELVKGVLEAD